MQTFWLSSLVYIDNNLYVCTCEYHIHVNKQYFDHCNAVTVVNLQNQIVPLIVSEGIPIYSHTAFTLLNSKKLLQVN